MTHQTSQPEMGCVAGARQMAGVLVLTGLLAAVAILELREPWKVMAVPAASVLLAGAVLVLPWHRWPQSSTALLVLPAFALLGVGTWIFDGFAAGSGPFYMLTFAWLGLHHPPLIIVASCLPAAASYVIGLASAGAAAHVLGSTFLLVPVAAAVGLLVWRYVRDLAAARDEVTREERWRAAMMSTLAHDVRSPLTSVLGAIEIVGESPEMPTRLRPVLDAAARQTNRIMRLATGLLEVDRIAEGHLRLDLVQVPLRDLALDVAAVTSLDRVRVDVADDLTVWADRDRLEQILVNLVNNALRHGKPPVCIDAHLNDTEVQISVRDHGTGVPTEDLPRLFSRFSSADRSPQSVGLGLWIVKLLARSHGGDATYEPAEPGAQFTVTLPLQGAHGGQPDPALRTRVAW